jgi:peptidoglycan/LPS O-acetylase OafA/YrhL
MTQTAAARAHTAPVEITFIHLLRAVAVLLVVYAHMVGSYLADTKLTWLPNTLLEAHFIAPLGIIQSFGFMGVCLFFLVSGYIITHVASAENRWEFLVKRLCRIYPPFIVSVLVYLLCAKWINMPLDALDLKNLLLNFSLLNYVQSPQVIFHNAAWSLVIEIQFYLMTLLLLTSLKRWPIAHVLLQSLLLALAMHYNRQFGANFFLFCASAAYLPYLIAGQLFYYHQRQRIKTCAYLALLGLQFSLLLWGLRSIHTPFLALNNSYLTNFVFSFALFSVLGMANLPSLRGFLKRIADMSYSIYLLHGSIGIALLNILCQRYAYLPSLLAALGCTLLLAYLSFRFIEKPSQRFARYLLARKLLV